MRGDGSWSRWGAIAGAAAPSVFIAGWVLGSALAPDSYSPIDDAISRLAASGAATWPILTGALVAYAALFGLWATSLRTEDPALAGVAAANTAATLAIAATPLDHSAGLDAAHGLAAFAGYVTLAALPLVATRSARTCATRVSRTARRMAWVVTLAGVGALAASTVFPEANGWWQRAGLTVLDCWVIWWAVRSIRARRSPDLLEA